MLKFTETQRVSLAIVPKFSAIFSIIGDVIIMFEMLYLDRNKLKRVLNRIIFAMTIWDFQASSANFMSSWPIPRDEPNIAFNIGNETTCDVQGFFIQMGIILPLLNSSLAIYYLLVIVYGWSEDKLRQRVEPFFHLCSISFGIGTCVAALVMDLFNNANLWCWIAEGSEGSNRGNHADLFQWAFYYIPVWLAVAFVIFVSYRLVVTFRQLDLANSRYDFTSTVKSSDIRLSSVQLNQSTTTSVQGKLPRRVSTTHEVAMQGLFWTAAFIMTFFFASINRAVQAFGVNSFGLLLLHSLFVPAQGFWNFCVYVRPRVVSYQKSHPESNLFKSVKAVLWDNYRVIASTEMSQIEHEERARKEMTRWKSRHTRNVLDGCANQEVNEEEQVEENRDGNLEMTIEINGQRQPRRSVTFVNHSSEEQKIKEELVEVDVEDIDEEPRRKSGASKNDCPEEPS